MEYYSAIKRSEIGSFVVMWMNLESVIQSEVNQKEKNKYHILTHTCLCACMLSHVQLFETPWTLACKVPLSMEFSRQEYWNGLPFPSPGDLSTPGIEPKSPASSASADGFFTTVPPGKPPAHIYGI